MVRRNGGSREIWGIVFAALAAVALGTEGVAAKLAYAGGANMLTTLALRFLFAATFFWGNLLLFPSNWRVDQRTFYQLIVLSLGGQALTVLLLFYAFQHIPAAAAILFFYIYPAIVTILAAVFLHEPLTRAKGGALFLAFLGLSIVLGIPAGDWKGGGTAAALLAALANGIFMVGQTRLLKRLEPKIFNAYATLTMGVAFLFVALMTGNFNLSFNIQALLAIAVLALITTVLAYMAMAKGLTYLGASRVAIICTLEPVVTAVLGFLVLGEKLQPGQILGGTLILLGVTWQQVAGQGAVAPDNT
ncbi:DMT family transporter [Moorella sp. E306M]|uniref:DMT family transporter n=1 Tax=Moorella sp. E306M TaxID=2572683 RepID=UPI0010FFAADE|nr:EamA family transporter [Moorella sp. E306M]GEA17025.1 hypothetical protein E306M_01590 [Moorella sp. E306M]